MQSDLRESRKKIVHGEFLRIGCSGSTISPMADIWLSGSKNLPTAGSWTYAHTSLHSRGAQFTFLEGHARRHDLSDYWDAAANYWRTNNPDLRWGP